MKLLMLLSGLVAWAARIRKGSKRQQPALRWLKPEPGTAVRIIPLPSPPPLHFSKEACQGEAGHPKATVFLEARNFPMLHDRPPEQGSLYRHGWYSAEDDRSHYFCKAADGSVVKVTNATQTTGGLAGWPDAVYVGELASPTPCPPPLPMTEERAEFVAALLERALLGRTVVSTHTVAGYETDTRRGGRIGNVSAGRTGGGDNWSVMFSLSGCTWFIDGRVGIHWGEVGPELWTETTAGSGAAVRTVFAPEGGYLDPADQDFWRAAKMALWTGNYFPITKVL